MPRSEIETIIAEQPNTSARARALKKAGVSTVEIGKLLSISYQHTYNILKRAGLLDRQAAPVAGAALPAGRTTMALGISADGTLLLTAELLRACGLDRVAVVIVRQTEQGLLLMSREAALTATLEAARARMPGEAGLIDALLQSPSGRGYVASS